MFHESRREVAEFVSSVGISREKCTQILYAFLFIVFGKNLIAAEALNAQDCDLIYSYQNSENAPFAEHFANMVHQRELCSSNDSECSVPLQKRIDDFFVLIDGERHIPSTHMREVSKNALSNVLLQIETATGLNARLDKPTGTSNYIYLVYVDKELASRRFDDYTAGWIVPDNIFKSFSNEIKGLEYVPYFPQN